MLCLDDRCHVRAAEVKKETSGPGAGSPCGSLSLLHLGPDLLTLHTHSYVLSARVIASDTGSQLTAGSTKRQRHHTTHGTESVHRIVDSTTAAAPIVKANIAL